MIPSAFPRAAESAPSPTAIAPVGELVEVLGSGTGSVLACACAQVQRDEPVAWIVAGGAVPHPTDLTAAGVCCGSLSVVRARGENAARAAEMLLASGGFGLVVVDGCGALPDRSVARLRALCRKHRARLLVAPCGESMALDRPQLGATVALRLAARLDGERLELHWAKNKAGMGADLPRPVLRLPLGSVRRPPLAVVAPLRPAPVPMAVPRVGLVSVEQSDVAIA